MQFVDRVQQTTSSSGTGSYVINSQAVAGYAAFAACYGDGEQIPYCVSDGSDYEVGIGTYASADGSLSRDTVLASSNSGALVDWGSGSKDIFVVAPAGILPRYAAGPPTTSDNPIFPYAKHIDVATGEEYVCVDNATDANVWRGSRGSVVSPVNDRLIHHYPLFGNADDIIGNEHGAFYGAAYIRDRAFFNEVSGERLTLSSDCWGLTTAWAVELIFCVDPDQAGNAPILHVTNSSGGNVFALWYRTDGYVEIYFNSVSSGQTVDLGISVGREYHMIMASDGYIYIDGIQTAIPNASAPGDFSAGTEFNLGSDVDSGPAYNNPLNGSVRDVRVYSAAPSAAEAAWCYAEALLRDRFR